MHTEVSCKRSNDNSGGSACGGGIPFDVLVASMCDDDAVNNQFAAVGFRMPVCLIIDGLIIGRLPRVNCCTTSWLV